MIKIKIREFVEKYEAGCNDGYHIRYRKPSEYTIDEIKAYVAENKQSIIAEIKKIESEKEANRPENKIDGYKEIKELKNQWYIYNEELNKMLDDGMPCMHTKRPEIKVEDLYEKYPVAAAYIKAENWEMSPNYAKSGAGRRAKKRIIDGEDHKAVIDNMEAEWSAHCEKNMWD